MRKSIASWHGGLRLLGIAAALGAATLLAAPTPAAAPWSKLSWRSVGPFVGGRSVAVAGVPGDANLFYMGTVGAGIWKSTDNGLQWSNISDAAMPGTSPSIGALAVAPSDASVIYAGTGESDIRNDMITGDGVFRSGDAGKTWSFAGLRDTHTISALAVDKNNPNVVYAASMGHVFVPGAERGVFKSTDGGQSWKKVLFVDDNTGAIALAMDPADSNVLYAGMWQAQRTPWSLVSGGPGSGLYKTTDGGAHWTNLSRRPGMPAGVLGRIGISVARSNPNVVYAIVQAKEGGIFRSADAGQSWTRVYQGWNLRQRGFYFTSIYADPQDPQTAYVPQVEALFVTHDGGKTFEPLKPPHGDNHMVWINPEHPNILLEANDGGATVSTDAGKSWSDEQNQPTGQFYHVELDDQFPFHIYGAQQDEGSTEGPSASDGGSIALGDWQHVAYGESTWVVPQPGNPNITYGGGYFSIFLKYNLATGQYASVSPWPNYQEGAASNELKYRFGWTHPILFSPANPKELLVGAQYVLKSDDYGESWEKISPDLTRNNPVTEAPSGGPIDLDHSSAEVYPGLSALAVSARDGNVIWAGSNDGLVHVTSDGGKTWAQVNPPGLPAESWISAIQPSAQDRASAYLATRRYMWDDFRPYVYVTHDLGQHWSKIVNGLPADAYVMAIRQDPAQPNLLFAGTKSTVYVSFDAGAQWQPLSLNLPAAQVRGIAINNRQGAVVIATHGRAFWVLDNLALLEQIAAHPDSSSPAPRLFAPQTAWLSHAYGNAGYGAPAGRNPDFGATTFFTLPANWDGTTRATLSFMDPAGKTVRSFQLHPPAPSPSADDATAAATWLATTAEPGSNRFLWDLHYPDATEVTGFMPPTAAGGLDDSVAGPVVTPGTYTVELDYGGQKLRQSFAVELDPRLQATPADLAACLALQLQIHDTLDGLDRDLNQAIALRDQLPAGAAKTRIESAMADLVQLDIHSSEGSLLHETKLRSHLAYLAADIALAYRRPTAAQAAVYQSLAAEARRGRQQLQAAMAAAR